MGLFTYRTLDEFRPRTLNQGGTSAAFVKGGFGLHYEVRRVFAQAYSVRGFRFECVASSVRRRWRWRQHVWPAAWADADANSDASTVDSSNRKRLAVDDANA